MNRTLTRRRCNMTSGTTTGSKRSTSRSIILLVLSVYLASISIPNKHQFCAMAQDIAGGGRGWLPFNNGKNGQDLVPYKKRMQLEAERKKFIQQTSRGVANTLLLGNTILLLFGERIARLCLGHKDAHAIHTTTRTRAVRNTNVAFPVLISSMIASKIIVETNDSVSFDGGSLKAFVSVFFSGIASLNGWLLKQITEGEDTDPAAASNTSSSIAEGRNWSMLRVYLVMGSRGTELTGGMILAFIHLMVL